eukprot:6924547-Pyramimonas_sp.AAC.1
MKQFCGTMPEALRVRRSRSNQSNFLAEHVRWLGGAGSWRARIALTHDRHRQGCGAVAELLTT